MTHIIKLICILKSHHSQAYIVWVKKMEVSWDFFPNGSESFSNILCTYCMFISWQMTKLDSIISKFDKVMPYWVQPPSEFSLFTEGQHLATVPTSSQRLNGHQIHQTLTHYHVCCAMLQPFRKLHSKHKTIPKLKRALQQIWDDLPQTTINKAINDFRKRLNAYTSACGGHFEHIIWTLYRQRSILTEHCLLFQ